MVANKKSPKSITIENRVYHLLCDREGGLYSMGFVRPLVITYYYPQVEVKANYRCFDYVIVYGIDSLTSDSIRFVKIGKTEFATIADCHKAIDKMIAILSNTIEKKGILSEISVVAQRRIKAGKIAYNAENEIDEVITYLVSDKRKIVMNALMAIVTEQTSIDMICSAWYNN